MQTQVGEFIYTASASCTWSLPSDLQTAASDALTLSLLSLTLCLGGVDLSIVSTCFRSWLLRLTLSDAGVFFSGMVLRDFTTRGTLALVGLPLLLPLAACFDTLVVRLTLTLFFSGFSIAATAAMFFLAGIGVVFVVLVAVSMTELFLPARLVALLTFLLLSTGFL